MLQGLVFDTKFFADNTYLFSIGDCTKASASALNKGSLKIQDWTYQW